MKLRKHQDDGPSQYNTLRAIDQLSRHAIRATFFVTGTQVRLFPDVLLRAYQAGHQIGDSNSLCSVNDNNLLITTKLTC